MPCNQKGPPPCPEPAVFRFTWPGQREKRICLEHALQLQRIALGMGLFVQCIPLTPEEAKEEHNAD